MSPETLLLRQIHPSFVQDGRVSSQAFRPTPKDEHRLSVDNGDRIQPEVACKRFKSRPNCSSIGVMAVSHAECESQCLTVIEDGDPYPEHCSIDFSAFGTKAIERKAKQLSCQARERDWLFQDGGME
ncbi:hypothetical protein G3480_11445 [Thiorhodococcus mannitoliphagus]|uniref:Uncharacterized protein n=1 Tax=Thiorhodococcus mannitoliphagus TaxID=329406 RepID=A0A6P1DTY8_9GAMM|nr:hypothetical protein [Thiorhodococcus mannitoliphagus]NEX20920.1 hypothetical protein [Thiorhodococcus mannitoliphagus]